MLPELLTATATRVVLVRLVLLVLADVAVDVVQSAVADLNVDRAAEKGLQQGDEGRHDGGARAPRQCVQDGEGNHPARNVPVGSPTAWILF